MSKDWCGYGGRALMNLKKPRHQNLSNPGQLVLDVVFIMFQVDRHQSLPHPSSTLMQKHACWKCHWTVLCRCCAVQHTRVGLMLSLILVAKFWTPAPKPLVLTKGQDCLFFFFYLINPVRTTLHQEFRKDDRWAKRRKKKLFFQPWSIFPCLVHLFLLLSLAARHFFFR